MTINDAADRLGLAPQTARHQARKKKLRARKMAGHWFVSQAEVERYRMVHLRKGQGDVAV